MLIPVFLYFAWVAGNWGIADVYARPAILTLNGWKRGTVQIKPDEWAGLISDLTRALALDKDNPEIHDWLGLAIEGPYVNGMGDWVKASKARRLAAEHYRESIRLQPTWPFAWADLATVKYRLRQFDPELVQALHKSIELGPWEPGIQRVVANIGMIMWYRLSDADRVFILGVIRRSFMYVNENHVKNMKALIERQNFKDRVCRKPDVNEPLKEYCSDHQSKT